jgi:hypothetical protein
MPAKLLFKNGTIENKLIADSGINKLISDFTQERLYLQKLKINDLLDFFQKLSDFWLTDKDVLSRQPYVKALAQFIGRKNFAEILKVSLRGNLKVLDSFETLGSSQIRYHCQPRGLVVHWLAGNAPLLGFYSMFQAMVTKNVSIIKPSSRAYEDFIDILATIKKVNTAKIKGKDLLRSVAVVLVDRNDRIWQTELSKNADTRIAWGGKEAIEAISSLPKKMHADDIMLGPKYSFGIIDKESLIDYKKIAAKIALDIATFDQYACSSPHTIFMETGGSVTPEEFAKELADSLEYVGNKLIKKGTVDTRKNLDILTLRAKYSMVGNVWSSLDTEWTVILSKENGFGPACASRVVFIKPVKSLREITAFIDRGKQTIGISLKNSKRLDLLKEITFNGVDRCVPYGRMTFFESPWDGMFITDRLVRWVSYYEN